MKGRLRVACVQLTAYALERAEDGLAHSLEMVDEAARARPDLMILPECTYPAYYLCGWPARQVSLRPTSEVLALFADRARRHSCYIAVGIAEESRNGRVYNTAFLLDPGGRTLGNARKQFLWHFDSRWFAPGEALDLVATAWGPVGLLVCADARLPEIPRVLALKGARLLIDTTNLVSTARDPAGLTNPQVEYMLQARAVENRVWVATSNKVGMEEDIIVYCGRSLVVSPDGDVLALGSPDMPDIVLADIPLPLGEAATIDGVFRPLADRRPDTYGDLVRPYEELPVASCLAELMVPEERLPVVAVLQLDLGCDAERLVSALQRQLRNLAVQGADVVVMPEPAPGTWSVEQSNAIVRFLHESTAELGLAVVAVADEESESGRGKPYRTAFFIERGRTEAKYRKTHLDATERPTYSSGQGDYCVVRTRRGNLGMMMGHEGLLPEVARILTLRGADIIVWPCGFNVNHHDRFARTRAAENRVFVAASNNVGTHGIGESLIVDPRGAVLAQAFGRLEQAVAAMLPVAQARCKAIVPGTDAIRGRKPSAYRNLVE